MELTRETVTKWMDDHRRSREWLAERCGVGMAAVGHWLNKKGTAVPIPAKHQITIRQLMEEDAASSQAKVPHNLVLEFDDLEYAPVEKAALEQRMTIREWARTVLNEAASMSDEEFFATFIDKKLVPLVPKAHIMAAAGPPLGAEVENWEGDDDTLLVRISGLSMVPLLNDGDVISMHHKRAARSPFMKKGLIYLVQIDGGYTVKRYNTRLATEAEIESGISYVSKADGKTKVHVLQSINPDFPEIVINSAAEWVAWIETKEISR